MVPLAGLSGENLVSKSAEMPWYAGPTAIESLDALGDMNRPAEPWMKARAASQCIAFASGVPAAARQLRKSR